MKDFAILSDALSFIEENLCENISQEELAANCYCSVSNLQKLFRYVFHESVGEYISKRRLTQAAKKLLETDRNVLDIAVEYGYNSAEVFTRSFTKLWYVTPTKFRKEWKFSDIHPKYEFNCNERGIPMKKRFDISELYDYLKSKQNTYVLSFDLCNLMPMNETYGREAGNKAILEVIKRISDKCGDDMLTFRIGGDEFVLVTGCESKDEVNKIAESILSQNGNAIIHNGISIPVSVRAGAVKIQGRNMRYGELFTRLFEAPNHGIVNINECYFVD